MRISSTDYARLASWWSAADGFLTTPQSWNRNYRGRAGKGKYMENFHLTNDEPAHITARRELAREAEKERLAEDRPADLDDIRLGMSASERQRVTDAIRKNWKGLR